MHTDTCIECGKDFQPTGSLMFFCSWDCKGEFYDREEDQQGESGKKGKKAYLNQPNNLRNRRSDRKRKRLSRKGG